MPTTRKHLKCTLSSICEATIPFRVGEMCGVKLLSDEKNLWCCGTGSTILLWESGITRGASPGSTMLLCNNTHRSSWHATPNPHCKFPNKAPSGRETSTKFQHSPWTEEEKKARMRVFGRTCELILATRNCARVGVMFPHREWA